MSEKKEKILFFIDSLGAGGAQKQIVTLARVFKEKGHDVAMLIYHDNYQIVELLNEMSIPVIYIKKKAKLDITFLNRLLNGINSYNPDVIISYLNTPNMWIRIASFFLKNKKIITSERNIDLPGSRLRVFIEKLLNRFSYKIVTNAVSIKNILCNDIGIKKSKVEVIYNGLDTSYFIYDDSYDYSALRRELNVNNSILLMLPGRIEKQKNHLCFIKAIKKMDKNIIKKLKIIFVGNIFDIELHEKLINKIKSYELEEIITFLGVRDDMKKLYNISDIVVLPSLWEGMPNVIIEAMSCSRLVVASDVSDNSLFMRDSINGFLFENDNEDSLRDKLNQAICLSENSRKLITANARDDIVKLCSLESFYNNYYKIIKKGN